MASVTRRTLLAASVSSAALVGTGGLTSSAVAHPRVVATGPILKPIPPEWFVNHGTNAEMRWASVQRQRYLTDPERLFVRNHTVTPQIDKATWRLRIEGDGVERATELSYADLRALPRTRTTTTLECTGNGRSLFGSQQGRGAAGTPWNLGAVGAVEWEGVRLAEVLARVGTSPSAVSVLAAGLDPAYVTGGVDYGRVRRPFPMRKALDDALLAWGMNGRPLLPDHGFPVRLVLPGWVGIASIKWLGSLEVSTTEQTSPWNTKWYRMAGGDFPADGPPLTVNPVRSAWELAWDAQLSGRQISLHGRAWSGLGPITGVEVSVDDGVTWEPARLHRRGRREAWTQWDFTWRRPAPGSYRLMSRATDVAGRTQPLVAAFNDGGYFFDAVVRHPVTVTS